MASQKTSRIGVQFSCLNDKRAIGFQKIEKFLTAYFKNWFEFSNFLHLLHIGNINIYIYIINI